MARAKQFNRTGMNAQGNVIRGGRSANPTRSMGAFIRERGSSFADAGSVGGKNYKNATTIKRTGRGGSTVTMGAKGGKS